jgi:hypothetical protein
MKSQITQERLYSEERRNRRNHKRDGGTAEKHKEIKAIEKRAANSPKPIPGSWEEEGKLKTH